MPELHHLTAQALWKSLQQGEVSPTELTTHYLDRIARLDGELGAFLTVTPDAALARAHELERAPKNSGALWGLPFADKDLVARKGVRTTYGSRLLADYEPEVSDELATVMDDAGGVSLGKTNTPEFGLPSYTENLVGNPEQVAPAAEQPLLLRQDCCRSLPAPMAVDRFVFPLPPAG